MAKADAVEVSFDGGERSATRWANSSITVNMVQYDQQLTLNVRHGAKQGSASTREFDDESLKAMVDEAQEAAQKARDNPNLPPLVKGPQDYMPVDAVAAEDGRLRPRRARRVGQAVGRHLREERRARRRLHPEERTRRPASPTPKGCSRYYQVRGDRLRPHLPHGERRRLGLVGHHRREGSVAGRRRASSPRSPRTRRSRARSRARSSRAATRRSSSRGRRRACCRR